MSKITVRFSDEEDAVLRAKAGALEVSISEFVRLNLFPDGAGADGGPATAGQVSLIEGRLDALVEEVCRLRETVEHGAVPPVENVGLLHRPSVICTPVLEPESPREMAVIIAALRDIYSCLHEQKGQGAGGESCQVAVQKVLTEVRESKRVADQIVARLLRFCRETLPVEVRNVTQYESQEIIGKCIEPLTTSARTAAREIDKCQARLLRVPWGWRLILGPLFACILTALATTLICERLMLGGDLDTLKREAQWGEWVKARIGLLPLKEQEKIYRGINGRH